MGFGDLRPGLRRLANGLVVYGVIGLIVTLLGLVALAWVGGRIDDLSDRTAARVDAGRRHARRDLAGADRRLRYCQDVRDDAHDDGRRRRCR